MKSLTLSAPDELFTQTVGALCRTYNYQEKVANPEKPTEQIDNPITPEDFATSCVLKWLREIIVADTVQQAAIVVTKTRDEVNQQMDKLVPAIETKIS